MVDQLSVGAACAVSRRREQRLTGVSAIQKAGLEGFPRVEFASGGTAGSAVANSGCKYFLSPGLQLRQSCPTLSACPCSFSSGLSTTLRSRSATHSRVFGQSGDLKADVRGAPDGAGIACSEVPGLRLSATGPPSSTPRLICRRRWWSVGVQTAGLGRSGGASAVTAASRRLTAQCSVRARPGWSRVGQFG